MWDLFLMRGCSVLFRVALTLFQMMQPGILEATDYGEIFAIVDKFGQSVGVDSLMANLSEGISKQAIHQMRDSFRPQTYQVLQ